MLQTGTCGGEFFQINDFLTPIKKPNESFSAHWAFPL